MLSTLQKDRITIAIHFSIENQNKLCSYDRNLFENSLISKSIVSGTDLKLKLFFWIKIKIMSMDEKNKINQMENKNGGKNGLDEISKLMKPSRPESIENIEKKRLPTTATTTTTISNGSVKDRLLEITKRYTTVPTSTPTNVPAKNPSETGSENEIQESWFRRIVDT